MDRFYEHDIWQILDEQGDGEGPQLTRAQIHAIGMQAVEKALGPQPDQLRRWTERVVERQLETVG